VSNFIIDYWTEVGVDLGLDLVTAGTEEGRVSPVQNHHFLDDGKQEIGKFIIL